MKKFGKATTILILIVCLTFLSAEIFKVYPRSLRGNLKRGEAVNVLFLGIDTGQDKMDTRSDTIILASIDNNIRKAILLWIPRDTRIYTSNKSKKINMVNQLQGPQASCKEVGRLLGIGVNHYVLINFSGFERIIDMLGGVYMDVDINLSSPSSGVYLTKGYNRLSGKEALKYVRYRDTKDGDIGRTQRQQKLLRALINEILQKETLAIIPELFSEYRKNVQTNISFSDMLYLANIAMEIDENNIVTQTLPGYAYLDPYSGASYWIVDPHLSKHILDSLYRGHHFDIKT